MIEPEEYRLWIADLDGTLYHQLPLRLMMGGRLAFYYVLHLRRIRELFLLRDYRKMREERHYAQRSDFGKKQVAALARRYQMGEEDAGRVITHWMEDAPLKCLAWCKRKAICEMLQRHMQQGKPCVVYSDYPTEKKLQALGLTPTASYSSEDALIGCMKPDARGLQNILRQFDVPATEAFYIGDREDRDGACAKSCGVAYMDVRDLEKRMKWKGL